MWPTSVGTDETYSCTAPLITSVAPCEAPLYGTCGSLVPACFWNSTVARCATVPLPEEAKLMLPGCAFASFTTSASVLNGEFALATIRSGELATRPTGVRSFSGSYGRREYSVGLIARLL